MKFRPFLALLAVLGLVLVAGGCSSDTDDAFINEYTELNGVMKQNGQTYIDVELPDDHRFVHASEDDIRELLDGGDGVIYFGFPECPWCRNAVVPMDQAAKDTGLDEISYLNVSAIRGGQGQGGTDFYQFLLDELGDHAPEYPTEEDPDARRILVPLVVIVVDGEVVGSHLGSAPSQDNPYVEMTDAQHDELVRIYASGFTAVP